jgi:hypothetical protein
MYGLATAHLLPTDREEPETGKQFLAGWNYTEKKERMESIHSSPPSSSWWNP